MLKPKGHNVFYLISLTIRLLSSLDCKNCFGKGVPWQLLKCILCTVMKTNNSQFFIFTLSTSSLGRSSSCSALVWCETGAIVSIVRWVAGFIGELNNWENPLRNPGSKIWRRKQRENDKMNHDCCFWCQDRAWLNDDLVTDSGTRNLIITESLDHKREIVEVFASEEHPCMQNIHKNPPLAASYWSWATKSVRIFICTIKRVWLFSPTSFTKKLWLF